MRADLSKGPEEAAVEDFLLGEIEQRCHQREQREVPEEILSSHYLDSGHTTCETEKSSSYFGSAWIPKALANAI
jgi:hypothetical protein